MESIITKKNNIKTMPEMPRHKPAIAFPSKRPMRLRERIASTIAEIVHGRLMYYTMEVTQPAMAKISEKVASLSFGLVGGTG